MIPQQLKECVLRPFPSTHFGLLVRLLISTAQSPVIPLPLRLMC